MSEIECKECGAPMQGVKGKEKPQFCSTVCRMRDYRRRKNAVSAGVEAPRGASLHVGHENLHEQHVTRDYTSSDIKILSPEEAASRFPYERIRQLQDQYRKKSAPDFIERLVLSCQAIGFDVDSAIRRYVLGDKSIVIPEELIDAHREQMRISRERINRSLA